MFFLACTSLHFILSLNILVIILALFLHIKASLVCRLRMLKFLKYNAELHTLTAPMHQMTMVQKGG